MDSGNLADKLGETTVEIFTTMLMMNVTPGAPIPAEGNQIESLTIGMIGLAGSRRGRLAIHLPNDVAMSVTGSFLGMDVDEVNEDVLDAVGELANMLGGNIKNVLAENGWDVELSLPSTISGEKFDIQSIHKNIEVIIVPFDLDDGRRFLVELQVELNN